MRLFFYFFMTNLQEQRRNARNGMKAEHGVWFIHCNDLLKIFFETDIIYGACAYKCDQLILHKIQYKLNSLK